MTNMVEYVNNVTVCLDGTLPGYHLDQGFGSGSKSWLIHLEVRLLLATLNSGHH